MTITIVDLETDGLFYDKNKILEIGAASVSDDLMTVHDYFHKVVNYPEAVARSLYEFADPFVQEMHTRNGLWEEIQWANDYSSLTEDLDAFYEWLQDVRFTSSPDKQLRLMGNSVWFDYQFLCDNYSNFIQYWDYHQLDLSVILEHLKMNDTTTFLSIHEEKPEEDEPHRVKDDIQECYELAFKVRHLMRAIPAQTQTYPIAREWDSIEAMRDLLFTTK